MATSVDATPEQLEPAPTRAPVNFLLVLWQRKWLVALGLTVGLVVGGIVAARAQPVYRSTAQILVIKKGADVVPVTGGDQAQSYVEDYMSTQMGLLKSPAILEKAVKKVGPAQLPSFAGRGDPAEVIASSLTVSANNGNTRRTILDLSYQGADPGDTAKILEAVIDSYREFVGGTYRNVSQETQDLISKARDILKQDLEVKEKEYRAFREKSPLLWKSKDGLNVHQVRIAEIEAKQSELVIRRAELEGRLKALEETGKQGKSPSAFLAPPAERAPRSRTTDDAASVEDLLAPLLLEEQALREDYGDDHPKLRAVRAKIALERKLLERRGLAGQEVLDGKDGNTLAHYVAEAKQELAQIDVSEKALKALLDRELGQAKELNHYEITDEGYRNELGRLQNLYEQTIRRLQEINLTRDFARYDTEVISPPAPGRRVAPSLLRILLLAAGLGLVGGMGLAYLADMTDKSFRTAEEIRRRLGLTLLGHIPFDGSSKEEAKANGNGEPHPALAPVLSVHHRPNSLDAEAYRGLRTALFFATQAGGQKVVQVTSPNKGDGKSTLVANLGVCIAQSGKRVILLDADFRRPRLDRLFGLKCPQGLTAVLTGEADPAALIHETGVPGLSLLPCGQRPSNPAELLTSPCLGKLLGELRESYDYVLVDTPPLLAVTDPCVVAGQVEGVLLAIRVSKNGRPAAERATEMLVGLGAPVLGVVVNGIGPDAAKNGYGYRYYSYYEDYHHKYKEGYEAEAEADGAAKPG